MTYFIGSQCVKFNNIVGERVRYFDQDYPDSVLVESRLTLDQIKIKEKQGELPEGSFDKARKLLETSRL